MILERSFSEAQSALLPWSGDTIGLLEIVVLAHDLIQAPTSHVFHVRLNQVLGNLVNYKTGSQS